MNLRRLLGSLRRRRTPVAEPVPEAPRPAARVSDGAPEPVMDAADVDGSDARVRLILRDGDMVPITDDDHLHYLAKNLLRPHERGR